MRKWSAITSSTLLNNAILNPYSALAYAIRHEAKGSALRQLSSARIAQLKGSRCPGAESAVQCFSHIATGSLDEDPPQHIFVVLLESYDAWPMLEENQWLNNTQQLRSLAKRGASVRNFVASSDKTIGALVALVAGLPQMSLGAVRGLTYALPTSLPRQLQGQGFSTGFFYGGMLSWHRVDEFASAQGFERRFGRGNIASANARGWGAHDDALYDLVLGNVNPTERTFNLVLTLSYHPPFDLDVEQRGYRLTVPPGVEYVESARMNEKIMGHLWFADQQLGRFVREAEDRFPKSLFVFTGDHFSRRFVRRGASLFERSAVPLVFYGHGSEYLTFSESTSGSHVDVHRTLLELLSPRGHRYAALGNDLAAGGATYGIGPNVAIGAERIVRLDTPTQEPLPWAGDIAPLSDHGALVEEARILQDSALWLLNEARARR
jgi:phosphoglycerol transferase MdoB-like AlkP superfamily enzyme